MATFITTSFSYLSGINEAGTGPRGSAELDIFAKPTFVQNLPPQTGYLSYSDQVELICQVISNLSKVFNFKNIIFLQFLIQRCGRESFNIPQDIICLTIIVIYQLLC